MAVWNRQKPKLYWWFSYKTDFKQYILRKLSKEIKMEIFTDAFAVLADRFPAASVADLHTPGFMALHW